MATKYYLNFFKEPPYNLSSIDKEIFYKNLKIDLRKNYKWKPSLFIQMVKENNLDFEHSLKILKWLNDNHALNHGRASKGFTGFILILENRFKRGLKFQPIQINERDTFIKKMDELRKVYFDIPDKVFFDFLDNNFDLGITRNYLETLYYQKIID